MAPNGFEIYIKDASLLLPVGVPLTGWQTAGLLRAKNLLMVGHISAAGELELNPGKGVARVWGPGDRLVVLAED